jgi:heme oxygenase
MMLSHNRVASSDLLFSEQLRDATHSIHREAERTGFIADLLKGRATRASYAIYLRNLVPVYAMLEAGLETLQAPPPLAPMIAAFAAPGFRRLRRLVGDVEAIAGSDWAVTCPLLPEAEAYARAIDNAAHEDGARLVAHAYARYLGDLSGGQILANLLTRNLGLAPDHLRFYAFPDLADVQGAKDQIRAIFDTIAPEGTAAQTIIKEAIAAFECNIALANAVERAIVTA